MIPNHILILGTPNTGKLRISQLICPNEKLNIGSKTHGGIIIKSELNTKYYSINLNLLIDEYPEERKYLLDDEIKYEELEKWYKEFISDECTELREVLDGLIFCINIDNDSSDYIEKCLALINKVRDSLSTDEDDWPGFTVVVGVSNERRSMEDVEDMVISVGFEFINFHDSGQNEFKDKVGKNRLIEIVETHDWRNIEINSEVTYAQNKLNKVKDMSMGLLEVEEEEEEEATMDLNDIFQKLQIAKEKVKNLDQNQREDYVNKVIEDVMIYL